MQARHACIRASGAGAPLAAVVEPDGAMEVGFHVPDLPPVKFAEPATFWKPIHCRRWIDRNDGPTNVKPFSFSRSLSFASLCHQRATARSTGEQIVLQRAGARWIHLDSRSVSVVPEGLHTQSNGPGSALIPATLRIEAPSGVTAEESSGLHDRSEAGRERYASAVFEREFLIGVKLSLASAAPGDLHVPGKLIPGLRYQPVLPARRGRRLGRSSVPATAAAARSRVGIVFSGIAFEPGRNREQRYKGLGTSAVATPPSRDDVASRRLRRFHGRRV
jgi:hypothetical protein